MKKKRVKRAAAKAEGSDAGQTPARIRRRLILRLAAVGLLLFILVAGLVTWGLYPRSLSESERAALSEYERVRLALADDDLQSAVRSAGILRTRFPQLQISKHAASLERCDSLESARQIFKEISRQAVDLARGVDGYFIGECPPGYKCPIKCSPCRMAEFGPWLQISPELKNPFMGTNNPHCGVLRLAR